MKIEILAIGKTSESYIQTGIDIYLKRLQHYNRVEFTIVSDVKDPGSLSQDQLKEKEGELFLNKITARDLLVVLDEKGKLFSSREFANFIDKQNSSGRSKLIFLIGGAFGFSEAVLKRADFKISLSPMTMSHQLVRLMFAEQLYRAHTILKGEPYHHD